MKQRIKLVLPAYNEELSLPSLLSRIDQVKENTELDLKILIVNDGSKDNTALIAKNAGNDVKLLDLKPNRGLAGAVREGLKEAIKDLSDNDIVILMDADDSQHPGLMPRMIAQIGEGSDIVIASRYRDGSRIIGLAPHRKFLSSGAGLLFRIFLPIKGVRDYTCGYRAYRVSLLKNAYKHYGDKFIEQQGFACMAEILLKLKLFKPVIHELPFILRYDQKKGDSKMSIWSTINQTIRLIIKG